VKNERPKKNPHAVALGRRRMSTLTPEERSALATRASAAATAALTPEERTARASHAVAVRWKGHVSADPRLDPITYLLSRGVLTEADLVHPAYRISRARYARRYLIIHCTPRGDGYKGRTERLLHDGLGCRYTSREHGYIISVPKAEQFVLLHADGWDANTISKALIAPAPKGDSDERPDGPQGTRSPR